MLKHMVVGFKPLPEKEGYIVFAEAIEGKKGIVGNSVITAFVHDKHLQKYGITFDTLLGKECYSYAIREENGTYNCGLTFKSAERSSE